MKALGLLFGSLLLLISRFAIADDASNAQPATIGNAARTPWTTSRITGSPEPPAPYAIERVFPNLQFDNPVELVAEPGSQRLFVVELNGRVLSFANRQDIAQADLLVDAKQQMSDRTTEKTRLYGLAFDPDYERNRFCYLCYITQPDLPDGTRVSRFRVLPTDPPQLDVDSEQVLITWPSGGHNGGSLKFGPDGCLYITTGDGANPFPPDPSGTGQDVSDLLASVLRIDVTPTDGDRPYRIPSDNPFVELPNARGEVWAYGLRNPWRMSFDSATGDLWVGDVGWELWEMIYRVERGGNYGWSLTEGPQPVHRERPRGPSSILPPTVAHSHTESRSITGGFVYRGSRLPKLVGHYVYGDYVTGKLWTTEHSSQSGSTPTELCETPLAVICFGVDHDNELYVVDYAGGIYRLIENGAAPANAQFPRRLSETGLFDDTASHMPAAGVISYSINAEPWADHAISERFVALPGTSQLGVYESTNAQVGFIKGDWRFPLDGVLAKTISLELRQGDSSSRRRLETQILHFDGRKWSAYSYHWNEAQTDAELAEGAGYDREIVVIDPRSPGGERRQTWHFASRTECLLCHASRGGTVYGFKPSQLNRLHDYQGMPADQLATLGRIGLVEQAVANADPPMPSPRDERADLEQRARAYLHVNCAHCHQRGGGGTAAIDVQFHLPMAATNLLNQRPTQGTFDIFAPRIFAPSDPYRSVLYYRMAKLGRGRMPHFGSTVVDESGLRLIHDWIAHYDNDQHADLPPAAIARSRAEARAAIKALAAPDIGESNTQELLSRLLSSTSNALMLVSAIDARQIPESRVTTIAAKAIRDADTPVRDLFERFVPPSQRVQRLGAVVDPEQILSLAGDAVRGEQLFHQSVGIACRNCHQVRGQGQNVGPDLSQVGRRLDRAKLLESILEPSKSIDPQFVSYLVETSNGRIVTGLLVSRDERQVILKDSQGKSQTIPADQVELLVPQQKSLMPELLLREMTAQEVADLIEYLTSLN